MKQRILTAAVMLAVFIPILIFSHLVVYPLAMAILAAIATLELLRCLGLHRDPLLAVAASLPAALSLLAFWADSPVAHLASIAAAFFLLALYLFATAVFRPGRVTYGALMGILGGSFYIAVAFSAMVLLRGMAGGAYLFLLPFVGAWVTDTFAYFTGRFLGKHKLAPVISPKKTVEGSVGGIVAAVLVFVLYGLILRRGGYVPSYWALALAGLLLSVVSQIGDLALSAVKREYGVKDYGRLFPGHGGVLDRFDSVIATAPLLLFFVMLGSGFSLFT
ncbi:MAG: phosphatidate cytidylyltransferase [Clostridia bacterium]|nr:phosphatidate cytidylyltransferase [Clostridia bacterium]